MSKHNSGHRSVVATAEATTSLGATLTELAGAAKTVLLAAFDASDASIGVARFAELMPGEGGGVPP